MYYYKKDYILREIAHKDGKRYFACFKDAEGIRQEIEVSEDIYMELLCFNRIERNCQSWSERNAEQSELTEETFYERTFVKPKSVEKIVIDKLRDEQVQLAIVNLPETQKRRIELRYYYEFTYEKIADIELKTGKVQKKCSPQAIKASIDIAQEKIKKFLRNRL